MNNEILEARVCDVIDISEKTQKAKFLGFLSKEESVYVKSIVEKQNRTDYEFYGGYDASERVMLGCFPDWDCKHIFPVKAVTFTFRNSDVLTHRDFLGALMSLGLARETVGDILVEKGRAVAFVSEDINNYIINQITKIGKVGVTIKNGYSSPLPPKSEISYFRGTVASDRLDCVVAELCNISRATAVQKIEEGFVAVNSVTVLKITKTLSDGDVISVRGKGKFLIDSLTDRTRKNRIILNYKKYI